MERLNESIWSATSPINSGSLLEYDEYKNKAQVIVIGAGITGLLCAYYLQQSNIDVIVLEANKIACGVTSHTTAKITSQHGLIYDKLIKNFGIEKAKMYAKANEEAILQYEAIIKKHNIECHFEYLPAYLYSRKHIDKIEREVTAAKKAGIKAEFVRDVDIPDHNRGSIMFKNQAQFHPLEFINGIIPELRIYEETKVIHIEGSTVNTTRGTYHGEHIIFATHYPIVNKPGFYFMRVHQEISYLLALQGARKPNGMYLGIDESGYSFRSYDKYVIFGGNGHRTGKTREKNSYENLQVMAKKFYPKSKELYGWSAQDCFTWDSIPYIGLYSKKIANWHVATGFRKWGMTNSLVAANIIRDMIVGQENEYCRLFHPQRFKWKASSKNVIKDSKVTFKGIIIKNIRLPKKFMEHIKVGHGGIINYAGMRIGVYKKSADEIYMVKANCTHLGCALEWNSTDLTWDCPCHGSRFTFKGDVIEGPAIDPLDSLIVDDFEDTDN